MAAEAPSKSNQVSVLFFASLRDAMGQSSLDWPYKASLTVNDLTQELSKQFPALQAYGSTLLFAVNEEYVSGDQILKPGDQLALLPPVSGG